MSELKQAILDALTANTLIGEHYGSDEFDETIDQIVELFEENHGEEEAGLSAREQADYDRVRSVRY